MYSKKVLTNLSPFSHIAIIPKLYYIYIKHYLSLKKFSYSLIWKCGMIHTYYCSNNIIIIIKIKGKTIILIK
jgi:hypothetical protein